MLNFHLAIQKVKNKFWISFLKKKNILEKSMSTSSLIGRNGERAREKVNNHFFTFLGPQSEPAEPAKKRGRISDEAKSPQVWSKKPVHDDPSFYCLIWVAFPILTWCQKIRSHQRKLNWALKWSIWPVRCHFFDSTNYFATLLLSLLAWQVLGCMSGGWHLFFDKWFC